MGASGKRQGEVVDEAATETGTKAWALWSVWRGAPDLVAHIIRTLGDALGRPASLTIELHIKSDVETFRDPDDFVKKVTGQGLRRFDRLVVWGPKPWAGTKRAELTFVRKKTKDLEWLPSGVLLTCEAEKEAAAIAMRDRISDAVSRGRLWRYKPSERGDSQDSLEEYVRKQHDESRGLKFQRLVSLALVPIALGAQVVTANVTSLGETLGTVALGIGGGACGGALVGLMTYLLPNLHVAEHSRARAAAKVAGALPLGALITQVLFKGSPGV